MAKCGIQVRDGPSSLSQEDATVLLVSLWRFGTKTRPRPMNCITLGGGNKDFLFIIHRRVIVIIAWEGFILCVREQALRLFHLRIPSMGDIEVTSSSILRSAGATAKIRECDIQPVTIANANNATALRLHSRCERSCSVSKSFEAHTLRLTSPGLRNYITQHLHG